MAMRNDTHWLLYFCYDNELLTDEQLDGIVANLDDSVTAAACAERLSKAKWVEDENFLKEAIEAARKNAREGYSLPELPGVEPVASREFGTFSEFEKLAEMDESALRKEVESIFQKCQAIGASDLHLTAGARPRIRHHRKIVYLTSLKLPKELARRMNFCLLTDAQKKQFEATNDLDYALTVGGESEGFRMRFRANLMEQKRGISGVYRIIANRVQSLEELGFPNAENIRKLLTYHNGIILVTGPVGSGKSTTLASLVNELNQNRKEHIITVENPIEFMQNSRECILTQREVGVHTASFRVALKSALREDPDIIVIGEMRDLETIEMAVTAAETGHLVIATMHTRDAHSTLTRILDVFPPRQQSQIRAMVSGSLRGILCQRLLPSTDGGVALACEFLINNSAVQNIVREGKDTGLESAMQTGRRQGMRTLNESLDALLDQGRISEETAEANRPNPEGER